MPVINEQSKRKLSRVYSSAFLYEGDLSDFYSLNSNKVGQKSKAIKQIMTNPADPDTGRFFPNII